MTDRNELFTYAAGLLGGGLESLPAPDEVEHRAERHADAALRWAGESPTGPIRGPLERVLRNVITGEKAPLREEDYGTLEAIVLPYLRPVGDVVDNGFTLPDAGEFADLLDEGTQRDHILKALPSVGCITVRGTSGPSLLGTAFAVGPGLVMTNRHVAQRFTKGLGRRDLVFNEALGPTLDPFREAGGGAGPVHAVTGVRMVHPYWDMALLEVPDLTGPALTLADSEVKDAYVRRVAVVGYPAFDPRNARDVQMKMFRSVFGVKRVAPGFFAGFREVTSFKHTVNALLHDASTLGGNSGSAVIDLTTGHALALHFGGKYLDRNWGVPLWQLACDSRVRDAGLEFAVAPPPAPPPWEEYWTACEEAPVAAAAPAPAPVTMSASAPGATPPVRAARAKEPVRRDPRTSMRFVVPVEITVEVGAPVVAADAKGATRPGTRRG